MRHINVVTGYHGPVQVSGKNVVLTKTQSFPPRVFEPESPSAGYVLTGYDSYPTKFLITEANQLNPLSMLMAMNTSRHTADHHH